MIRELDQCPRQLLDEERHAIGPGDDFPADRLGQRLASLDSGGHRLDGSPAEPVEDQAGDVGMARQIWLAVWPAGQEHEDTPILNSVQHQVHKFERRGINPVHVLEDYQRRPASSEALHQVDQRCESPAAANLWREFSRAVALFIRNAQQVCDQRARFARPGNVAQQALDPVELGCRRVVG